MKYIITEEQYNKIRDRNSLFWIKRRYGLVKESLKETFGYMEFDICRTDDYEKFERKFFTVFMDSLHPIFYEDENFNYDDVLATLMDIFYVECTEFYFAGRKKC